jgi:hypothetical protein
MAAEEYLQAGDAEAGTELLHRTLRAHGLRLPGSRNAALASLLRYRLQTLARGLSFRERAEPMVPHADIQRLDAMWLVWRTSSIVDHTAGMAFGARYLHGALRVGEPVRVMRGLAGEAVALSATSGRAMNRRVDRMLNRMDELRERVGNESDRAGALQARGLCAWFRGQPRDCLDHLDAALEIYRSVRRAVSFDVSQCQCFRFPALALLGQVRRLRGELEQAVGDARRRGDRFLVRNSTGGLASLRWIADDDTATALELATASLREAPEAYSTQHYYHLLTSLQVDLYLGRGAAAWRRITHHWATLRANHFLLLSYNRDELRQLRARAALACAAEQMEQGPAADLPSREKLLSDVESQARSIERHGLPIARPWSELLRAGVANLRGDRRQAMERLALGQRLCRREGLELYRAAARLAHGNLRGDDEGAAQQHEATTWMRDETIVDPMAMARMLVPGTLGPHPSSGTRRST